MQMQENNRIPKTFNISKIKNTTKPNTMEEKKSNKNPIFYVHMDETIRNV